jgi:hypothetical protein
MYVYNKEIFDAKDDIQDTFVCSRCQHVTFKFLSDQSGHNIGRLCCGEGMMKDGFCPIDGHKLKEAFLEIDLAVTEAFKEKVVRCPFGPKCQWKGQFAELDAHLEQSCIESYLCFKTSCSVSCICEDKSNEHAQSDNSESFECFKETKEFFGRVNEEKINFQNGGKVNSDFVRPKILNSI